MEEQILKELKKTVSYSDGVEDAVADLKEQVNFFT